MLHYIHKPDSQKELYFSINNCIEFIDKEGVYAIYNGDICSYVGQSKNVASRLATHLSGKYANCTDVYFVLNHCENSLDATERFLIQELKPTDNIMVNYDEELNKDEIFESFHYFPRTAELWIKNDGYHIVNEESTALIKYDEVYPSLDADGRIFNELLSILHVIESAKK